MGYSIFHKSSIANFFSITFLLLVVPSFAHAMEQNLPRLKWGPEEFHKFADLMPELQNMVFSSIVDISESQEEATKAIQALTVVNKACNALVNTTDFTRNFIKKSRDEFKTTDLKMLLGTEGGRKLFNECVQAVQSVLKYTVVKHNSISDQNPQCSWDDSFIFKTYTRTYNYIQQQRKTKSITMDDLINEYDHLLSEKPRKISTLYTSTYDSVTATALLLFILDNTEKTILQPCIMLNRAEPDSTPLEVSFVEILTKNTQEIFQSILLNALLSKDYYSDEFPNLVGYGSKIFYQSPLRKQYEEEARSLFEFV